MQEVCYRGVGRAGGAKGGEEGACEGARRRARRRKGLFPKDQESAFGLKSRSLHSQTAADWASAAGAILLQFSRNPEASTRLGLLEPVVCAVAYSPSQLLAFAADKPEAGKKCCVSLPTIQSPALGRA